MTLEHLAIIFVFGICGAYVIDKIGRYFSSRKFDREYAQSLQHDEIMKSLRDIEYSLDEIRDQLNRGPYRDTSVEQILHRFDQIEADRPQVAEKAQAVATDVTFPQEKKVATPKKTSWADSGCALGFWGVVILGMLIGLRILTK